jgi:hypothetical protein
MTEKQWEPPQPLTSTKGSPTSILSSRDINLSQKQGQNEEDLVDALIVSIRKYGITAQGRRELIKILKGQRATYKERCLALCYDCMNYYHDGKRSCQNTLCPLYAVMPYRDGINSVEGLQ